MKRKLHALDRQGSTFRCRACYEAFGWHDAIRHVVRHQVAIREDRR